MKVELTPLEGRVVGALIEKEITTPDQYPLSLNALVNACNQKSNRDPVMQLDEETVQATVDALKKKHLVVEKSGFGSRVPKFQHRFFNHELGDFRFDARQTAVMCELMLRGPQTPGELRGRAQRLAKFADVAELEATLQALMTSGHGPFVARLAREPGRRESRYAQLLTGEIDAQTAAPAPIGAPAESKGSTSERLSALESTVEALSREVESLREAVDKLTTTPVDEQH
ncbi:MAG: YceH family protein [Gammaproteobacteria bacterium]